MNRPTIYFVDINDPDETGTYESNYRHTVLAADYDALFAENERLTRIADHWRQKVDALERELLPHRIAAGHAMADAALAGQPQHGTPEWPKEQCPVTGAIRDVDPADLGDQQQGEQCSTCRGTGEIDQRLGGEWNSPVVPCPDCDGEGEPDDNWIMSPCSQGHTDVGAAGGIAHCYICGESVTGETTEEAWRKWEITHAHFKAEQSALAGQPQQGEKLGSVLAHQIAKARKSMSSWSPEMLSGLRLDETAGYDKKSDRPAAADQQEIRHEAVKIIHDAGYTRAPAAVVMPARMTTIPEGKTISYAAGYEDALDAVANLNRNTVPLELLNRLAKQFRPRTDLQAHALLELRAILGDKP